MGEEVGESGLEGYVGEYERSVFSRNEVRWG